MHLVKNPCIDCGESDLVVLDFDHVRGQKAFAISRLIVEGTSVATLQREMDKCVVRRANCHRRKTALERGPYRNMPWLYRGEGIAEPAPGEPMKLWDGGGSNSRQMA